MDVARQLALADLSLVESTREFTRRTPGTIVREEDGVMLFAGVDSVSSGLVRTAAQPAPPAEATLATADAFFGDLGLGYAVVSRAHLDADLEEAAASAGFSLARELPGMVLTHPVPALHLPGGTEVRRVDDGDGRRLFAEIQAEVMTGWEEVARAIFDGPNSLLATPRAAGFIAYAGDEPASAAMVSVMGCVAGVDWVATRDQFRGRGLGEAVTRAASNAGFELGARLAALQANPLAEPMYMRAGYVTITRYRWLERASRAHQEARSHAQTSGRKGG